VDIEDFSETPVGVQYFNVRFVPELAPDGTIFSVQSVAYDITDRKKAGEGVQKQLLEKETLLMEVHHRIKNNIASIESLLSLQAQSVKNPEALSVLQDAIGRVKSMRILYDKLLIGVDYKESSVKNYIESLVNSVAALFPDNEKIRIDTRIRDFNLVSKKLFPLGIVINELLTNIMKHAFAGRDGGQVTVSLEKEANHVTLTVQDDGNGLPADFDINTSKGFGFMLIKMLSEQLGGSYTIENNMGTRSILKYDI